MLSHFKHYYRALSYWPKGINFIGIFRWGELILTRNITILEYSQLFFIFTGVTGDVVMNSSYSSKHGVYEVLDSGTLCLQLPRGIP